MDNVLKASVQYDDWTGTVAADDSDDDDVCTLLRQMGMLDDTETLVAVKFYASPDSQQNFISVKAIVANASGLDEVAKQLQSDVPLSLTERDLDVSIQEYFNLFKRFEVVLTRHGLDLDGKEYQAND